jgi:hypothetical protein
MVSGMPSFACSGPNGVTAEVSEALEPRLQQAAAKNLVLAKVEQEARQACVMAKPLITSRGATVVCAQGGLGVFLRRLTLAFGGHGLSPRSGNLISLR